MAQHIHRDLIVAWADGAQIQFRIKETDAWHTIKGTLFWTEDQFYRVKPEIVYPVTKMSGEELERIFNPVSAEDRLDLITVANAAIKHALDNGQVFLKESDK